MMKANTNTAYYEPGTCLTFITATGEGTFMTPFSQISKLKHREVK